MNTDPSFEEQMLSAVVRLLNEAFELDPNAIHALCANRIPVNTELAEHPSIQVGCTPVADSCYHLGLIGLLNGLFPGMRRIAMEWDEGVFTKFVIASVD